ncbi:hypothetical protein GCM10028820_30000 [Tessaracoccus terricola]
MTPAIESPQDLCEAIGVPFSEEQLRAITAPLSPAVIIAGAGTGKTTVMAARVVWLVGTGQVRPEQVLGLTFTRKAAQELAGRVADALASAGVLSGDDSEGAEVIQTYDSFAAGLVAEFGLRLGLDSDPVMLTGASRFRLAARAVAAAPGPFRSISRLSHTNIPERVLDLDAQLQSHLVDPEQVVELTRTARAAFEQAPLYRGNVMKDVAAALAALDERLELLELVADYQQLKTKLGLVEYADQLRRSVQLATTVPEVAATLRRRFRVVLLDEYQDTSAAQAVLLRALFGNGFPVTAVGDPHQAIYGWRGAAANNILDFPRLFPMPDGSDSPRLTLRTNRRSGQRILDVGNRLAESLASVAGAEGVRLVAPPETPEGRVDAAVFDTLAEELDALAERIIAEHESGTPWPDIAVLVRRNLTLAQVYEVLRDRDVPTEIVGLGGLLHLPEVVPVVATLRVLDDVAANPAAATLLTGPRWRIGLRDLEVLGRRARELAGDGASPREVSGLADLLADTVTESDPGQVVSLLDAVADPGDAPLSEEGRHRLAQFAAELAELRRHVAEPVVDLVRRVIGRLGLEVELLARPGGDSSQLARFLAAVSEYVDVDGDGSLGGFLAYLDAEERHGIGLEQAVPSDADSVKLLTMHRAKGLEWHTVFVPALADKTFPSQDRGGIWPTRAQSLPSPLRGDASGIPQLGEYTKKGMEAYKAETKAEHRRSEDRLAYVAATRAKQLLVASGHVWTPGLKRPHELSDYFVAIAEAAGVDPQDLDASVENPQPRREAVAQWPPAQDTTELVARRDAAAHVASATELLQSGASPERIEDWVWDSGTAEADSAARLAGWDADAALLADQHRRRRARDVGVPEGLSATALMAMAKDPEEFAARLLRPMPRHPSTGASLGTRFHDWVQRRFATAAVTFDELAPVRGAEPPGFAELVAAFEAGRFAHRQPLGVEVPFLLHWDQHVLRGRIDAVHAWDGERFDHVVIDWKTSNRPADPLQLAVYRQAWARANRMDPERVGAAFYHVLADELVFAEAPATLIDEALLPTREP